MNRFPTITAMLAFTLAATFSPNAIAQQTPSGAPIIPIPSSNVRQAAPAPGTAPKIQIGRAETFQLDNGLRVIVVENHKLPRVSFQIFVDNAPVLEKEAAGYTQLMGELLTKGTKNRSKTQIDEEVDFIGATLSPSANGLSGACLSKHAEKLLDIMSDALLHPTFPAEELDKAKRLEESNLAQEKDDPDAIADNVGSVLCFGKNHPYGEIMTETSLAQITLEQITKHYNFYFKPNISYFVVVGDITRAEVEMYAKKYFGSWQGADVSGHRYPMPQAPSTTQVNFVHKPGAVQSVVNIIYPIELKPGAPDAIAARLLNNILGGSSTSSRLNANLRETKGWTYGAYSALNSDKLVGSFSAEASVRNAVTDSAIVEFLKELNRLRTEPVPQGELQTWKNIITGQFSQSLERPGTVASFALSTARYKLPADYYEKYLQALQNVSADEVMAAAKKYITPDRAHILVVGNKDDVADKLKQFSPAGKVNFYDVYGNPVSTDDTAIPSGMTAEKIIEDYVNAIGGKAKIAAIKDLQMSSSMNMGGAALLINTWQKDGKSVMKMTMNGQAVNTRIYDGAKATESGMNGNHELTGEELNDAKEQAAFCKEADYLSKGYKLALKGIENLNGSKAYVVEVLRPDGKKSTDYYDMKSSLKIREISTVPGQDGQPVTMTTDFSDYKESSGVLFPNTVTLSGIFPIPVKVVVQEIKVNAGIDDAMFKQ